MKNFFWTLLVPLLAFCACNGFNPITDGEIVDIIGENTSDMLVLGDKLNNPYSVKNISSAFKSLYPDIDVNEYVKPTDIYMRFLPEDDTQMKMLEELGLELVDHPLDYEIVKEGDYYHDPDVSEDRITWQYSTVPLGVNLPECIKKEWLDVCVLNLESGTKAGPVDWRAVEAESYRLTGNEAILSHDTKGSDTGVAPEGRITIADPQFSATPQGVKGVKVSCNTFV